MAVFFSGYASNLLAGNSELRDRLLSCSRIEDDARRLDCVDQLIESISTPVVDESIAAQAVDESIATQAVVESEKSQGPQESLAEESSINESGDDELGQKYLRKPQEAKPQTSLDYTLISVYKDRKNRWIFKFDNGQVWQQVEPRYLPRLENFPIRVGISEGVFGSHDLRAENYGKPVKVRRLE